MPKVRKFQLFTVTIAIAAGVTMIIGMAIVGGTLSAPIAFAQQLPHVAVSPEPGSQSQNHDQDEEQEKDKHQEQDQSISSLNVNVNELQRFINVKDKTP